MTDDILEHFGVKGMQWGVSRSKAQLSKARDERKGRKDPSTPEGKEIQKRKTAAANRRLLNDKDLDQLVDRLRKEKSLKELVSADVEPGKAFASNIMSSSGNKVVKGVVTSAGAVAGGLILSKVFGKEVNVKTK